MKTNEFDYQSNQSSLQSKGLLRKRMKKETQF